MSEKSNTLAGALIGAAIVLSALIFASSFSDHLSSKQTLKVVGSAKKPLTSDFAILGGTLGAGGTTADIAYEGLERQKPILVKFFESNGLTADDVQFERVTRSNTMEYNAKGYQTGKILKYSLFQRFKIESNDVKKIKDLALKLSSLITQGVHITIDAPRYYYSKLAEIKVEVQALAAADAMRRGKKIADATDSKLGPLRTARMGVLQITPRGSTEISDYGMNDTSSIEKEITAVVQATFSISN